MDNETKDEILDHLPEWIRKLKEYFNKNEKREQK